MSSAPRFGPGAAGFDAPAVRLDQPPHDRQPDAETAVSPIQPALALHEQIEDPRQEIRRDADAGVAHAQDGLATDGLDLHGYRPARGRVLDRIRQQVGDHLFEAHAVAAHQRAGEPQLAAMMIERVGAPDLLDAPLDQGGEIERRLLQDQLAGRDPRDVEQIVHDAGELLGLAPDHAARLGRDGVGHVHAIEQRRGARDGGERVAQLVRDHRDELVLATLGLPDRLLRALAPRDVRADAHHPRRPALPVREHLPLAHDPVRGPAVRAAPELGLVVGAGLDAATNLFQDARAILGVYEGLKGLERSAERPLGEPMNRLEVLRPADLTRLNVPLEASHIARLERETEPRLIAAQSFRGVGGDGRPVGLGRRF